ncbi:MAG TPA: ABC transporter ATP-binding protein [Tepidisphaeraceae bacterium]|nr:ABC transporter ATP-binding protein [Tepidisphaeraceae bacterium]
MTKPQPQIIHPGGGTSVPLLNLKGSPILRVHDLRKSFRMGSADINVLRQVNLTVNPGEFIAIEGRSGSGKSTLLHLLGALDTPDGGDIHYNAQSFTMMSQRQRCQVRNHEFGFVFQFYHLLPELNVLENTLLAAMVKYSWLTYRLHKRQLRKQAIDLLAQLGLADRMKHKPAHLSGGERQRVAIARALMNEPKILFADEPTGNLDAETGRQIMNLLEDLHRRKNQTIIMVTHDRTLAGEADRVLVLRDGKLEKIDS